MPPLTIMLVEAPDHVEQIAGALEQAGHNVVPVTRGAKALDSLIRIRPSLVLFDLAVPDTDGLTLLSEIAEYSSVPMIALSSIDAPAERTLALKLGADDVVDRPVDMPNLKARIMAVMRRYDKQMVGQGPDQLIEVGQLECWPIRGLVCAHGRHLPLTPAEHRILKFMMQYRDQALTRATLYTAYTGATITDEQATRAIEMHIMRLRHKLAEAYVSEPVIVSVRGIGYKLSSTKFDSEGEVI